MTEQPERLPSLAAVQSALYRVTGSMAAWLGGDQSGPPAWSELEWRLAPAAAAIHGTAPLLATLLPWQGPAHWNTFLAEQRRHTLLRQQRIEELLARMDERARTSGIAILALKGAALLAAGLYEPGERPMADLDLLVHPGELQGAVAVLLALSYRDAGATWKHRGFDPPNAQRHAVLGEDADNPIKIDLHHRVAERLPIGITDLTDLIRPRHAAPGINAYPGAAAMMTHLLAHTAGNMAHRGARLIQLCDIARLGRRMEARDWEALVLWHGRKRRLWWAAAPLTLVARYFPDTVSRDALAQLERDCPWTLRRTLRRWQLADFSHCHLYIDPLPGITWTRSPAQAARYVGSRVFPSREQRTQMQVASRTGPWVTDARWYRQSQIARILQWLTSRPTRTATMQPVLAALSRTP